MSLYKGRALKNQDPAREMRKALAREIHRMSGGRDSDEFDPDYNRDDGRCDEDPPDSGWVAGFNAAQRGER